MMTGMPRQDPIVIKPEILALRQGVEILSPPPRAGACPACGGKAVFREIDGREVGACAEGSKRRCWWTT